MKNITFLIAFLLLFKPLFPVVEYAFDYDYISKVLCVNKEKPQMKCNGKCHLMKELAKNAETEKPASEKKNNFKDVENLVPPTVSTTTFQPKIKAEKLLVNSAYTNLYKSVFELTTFHPPTHLI